MPTTISSAKENSEAESSASLVAALIEKANPDSELTADEARQAARDLTELAKQSSDNALAVRAMAWRALHAYRCADASEVVEMAPAMADALDDLDPADQVDIGVSYLRSLTLAGVVMQRFSLALDAAFQMSHLAKDDPRHRLDAGIALGVALERAGVTSKGREVLEQAIENHTGPRDHNFAYALNALVAILLGAVLREDETIDDDRLAAYLDDARSAGAQALQICLECGNKSIELPVRGNLCQIEMRADNLAEAQAHLERADVLANELGVTVYALQLQATRAHIALKAGDPEYAFQIATGLLNDLAGLGDNLDLLVGATNLAYKAARQLGRTEETITYLEQNRLVVRKQMLAQMSAQEDHFVTTLQVHKEREYFRLAAERDPLTRLGNRRRLGRALQDLDAAFNDGSMQSMAVLTFDVDHFKTINDDYGHSLGDNVLIEIASLLVSLAPDPDLVFRLGGDEFVMLLPEYGRSETLDVANALLESMRDHQWHGLAGIETSASIGMAQSPPLNSTQLIDAADQALYAAKQGGRNQVVCSPDHTTDA